MEEHCRATLPTTGRPYNGCPVPRSEIPTALASPHVRRYWATYKPGNPLGKRIFPDVNCFIIFCISLNWFSS